MPYSEKSSDLNLRVHDCRRPVPHLHSDSQYSPVHYEILPVPKSMTEAHQVRFEQQQKTLHKPLLVSQDPEKHFRVGKPGTLFRKGFQIRTKKPLFLDI